MRDDNKEELQNVTNEAASQPHGQSAFTPGQLRALKWMTSLMGVLIIICIILLAIGLSRNADKLGQSDMPSTLSLPEKAVIKSMAAAPNGDLWLYITQPTGEAILRIAPDGGLVGDIAIERASSN